MALTLGKDKRLKSRKSIEALFTSGKTFKKYPLRIVYTSSESDLPEIKVGVSVSKKKFKKAVDRNLIKRRMREAYRINQFKLNSAQKINLMFIYTSDQILSFDQIEQATITLLDWLNSASNARTSSK